MNSLTFGPRVEGYLRTADTRPNNVIPLEVWKQLRQQLMAKVRKSENPQWEQLASTTNDTRERIANVPGDQIAVGGTEQQDKDIAKVATVVQSTSFHCTGSRTNDRGGASSSPHDSDDDDVTVITCHDGLDEALEELNQSSISIKISLAKTKKQLCDSSHCKRSRLNPPPPHVAPALPCLVRYNASQRRVKARIPENDPYMMEDSVWPTHLKLRRHVFQVPRVQPFKNDENLGFRIIYYIQNCLRANDNGGLEAAIHMAKSLQIPLQAFVSVSSHTKACHTMAGIATASALCGLEDSLQKIGIPLLGIICSPSTALKLLNEGLLPDCRIYAIILDDSMYPEHMADVQAIKDSLPNVLLNLVDSNSIGPLRQFHFQHVKKTTKSMSDHYSTIGKMPLTTVSKGDINAWCMKYESEAIEWINKKEANRMDGKVLMDDLQASLYVDFNVTQPNRYNYHKQLFIPSSLYETPGLEIVDWSILRATVNSTLKSRSSRADGEDTGLNIVKIYGATEKRSLLSHTFSSYSSKTKVADIALCRLVDLLKNGKGYTICEDLTGEGMRGDVLTLLRVGVLSPLRVLCEIKKRAQVALPAAREMIFLRDYHTYACYANALGSIIMPSLRPDPHAYYKELGSDDGAWTDKWFCESLPDWVVAELKLHCTDKRQQCYEEEVLLRGVGHDRLFTAIVKVLKDKGILHPFLGVYLGQAAITQSSDPLQAMKLVLKMSREYCIGHAISAEVGSSLICDVLEGNVFSVPRTRRSHPIFGRVAVLSADDVRAKWSDPATFLLFLKSATTQNHSQK